MSCLGEQSIECEHLGVAHQNVLNTRLEKEMHTKDVLIVRDLQETQIRICIPIQVIHLYVQNYNFAPCHK